MTRARWLKPRTKTLAYAIAAVGLLIVLGGAALYAALFFGKLARM